MHIKTSLNVKSSDHNNVTLVYESNLTVAMRMSCYKLLVQMHDMQASRLQAKDRRCYLSQNIGPAVTGCARPGCSGWSVAREHQLAGVLS